MIQRKKTAKCVEATDSFHSFFVAWREFFKQGFRQLLLEDRTTETKTYIHTYLEKLITRRRKSNGVRPSMRWFSRSAASMNCFSLILIRIAPIAMFSFFFFLHSPLPVSLSSSFPHNRNNTITSFRKPKKTHTHTHTHKHIQTQIFFLNPSFALDRFLRSCPILSVPPMVSRSRALSYVSSKLVRSACHARTQRLGLGLGLGFRFRDFTSWNHSNLSYFDF